MGELDRRPHRVAEPVNIASRDLALRQRIPARSRRAERAARGGDVQMVNFLENGEEALSRDITYGGPGPPPRADRGVRAPCLGFAARSGAIVPYGCGPAFGALCAAGDFCCRHNDNRVSSDVE